MKRYNMKNILIFKTNPFEALKDKNFKKIKTQL